MTLKQFNNPFEEQQGNSCTISTLCMAIENMYNQKFGKIKLNRKEIGQKISQVIYGDKNLIFTLGGNLEQVVKSAQEIKIIDDKGRKVIVTDVKKVNISYNSILEEIKEGRPICYSGLGSLSNKDGENWFFDKGNKSSHAMLLDTVEKDYVEFQNSLNGMERVKATLGHIGAKTLNFWSFKVQLFITNSPMEVTEKISNEKWVSLPEDQRRGSSCTMFSFENCFALQMNKAKNKRDTNLNEYNLNTQVEIFHGYPLGYIDKNGFNPERILEAFSEIEIGNTGIQIAWYENMYLGNHESAVTGLLNYLWKGFGIMVGCKGYSKQNTNEDWEWVHELGKPVNYHEMMIHSFEKKGEDYYFVCENSYLDKPRMYIKMENVLNIVMVAHVFELDFTNSHVEVLRRGSKQRELTLEDLKKLNIL